MGTTISKNSSELPILSAVSGDTVTLTRYQTKHTPPYSYIQRNGKCGSDVWHWKTGDGKPQVIGTDHTAYCDKPNPRVCFNKQELLPEKANIPTLTTKNLTSVKFKDWKSCTDHKDKCPVNCTYDTNSIDTPKEMQAFLDIWKNDANTNQTCPSSSK